MNDPVLRERMVIPAVTAKGSVKEKHFQVIEWEESPDDYDRIAEALARMTLRIVEQIKNMGMFSKVRLTRRAR